MRQPLRFATATWAIIWLVGAHSVVGLLHGVSHVVLGVVPSPADIAFIVVVIGIVPIGLLPFVLRGSRAGVGLFALAFAVSWLYGMLNHFVIEAADHVPGLDHGIWQAMFTITGAMILGLEAAGTLLAVWLFWQASTSRLRSASATRGQERLTKQAAVEGLPADGRAAGREECLVDVGATHLVSGEAAEAGEPGECLPHGRRLPISREGHSQ